MDVSLAIDADRAQALELARPLPSPADGPDVLAVRAEHLDALVAAVEDEDVAGGVHGHVEGRAESQVFVFRVDVPDRPDELERDLRVVSPNPALLVVNDADAVDGLDLLGGGEDGDEKQE